jgi:ectoine hydroxylase-related dioxygenase (phytanoyl-CoA dioxygenase family)
MQLVPGIKPHSFESDGFAIVPAVVNAAERERLLTAIGPVAGAGRRGILTIPEVADLAHSTRIADLIRTYFQSTPTLVRGIYFDKSAESNWFVGWHQDVTIAVRERIDVDGFGPWSVKDGIPHVQPPVVVLEQMLAVRIHLDDADETNGALRVVPGSHRSGRLSAENIDHFITERREVSCTAATGDALLMRPLILHASSRSTSNRHRRILHVEYAACSLPGGLAWHEAA